MLSRAPGLDERPADEQLTHVHQQAQQEDEAPQHHEGEAEVEIALLVLGHVGQTVPEPGGVIEQRDEDGHDAAHRDLDLEQLQQLGPRPPDGRRHEKAPK